MSADSISSAEDVLEFDANPVEAINLQTAPQDNGGDKRYSSCRSIRPLADGVLAVKLAGSNGQVRELNVTEGQIEPIQAISIETGTTVATRVYY